MIFNLIAFWIVAIFFMPYLIFFSYGNGSLTAFHRRSIIVIELVGFSLMIFYLRKSPTFLIGILTTNLLGVAAALVVYRELTKIKRRDS